MSESKRAVTQGEKPKWVRIPDGTKVRDRLDGQEGAIDGLTEITTGSSLNPDGRTQYRVNVGAPTRHLAAEADLLILTDQEGLAVMARETPGYRRSITEQLHATLPEDRFVSIQTVAGQGPSRLNSALKRSANDLENLAQTRKKTDTTHQAGAPGAVAQGTSGSLDDGDPATSAGDRPGRSDD